MGLQKLEPKQYRLNMYVKNCRVNNKISIKAHL